MRVRNLGALLVALLIALPAWAQEQRGSLDGVVKDAQGAAIPGANIEATNAAGLTVTAVSDGTGHYRFPSLPPGRYTVTAHMSGFSSAKVQDVKLALGQLLTVDLTLSLAGVTETIEVSVEAPLIEVKQSARFANLREEALTKVPRGRDFTTVATQAPGTNNENTKLGGLSIDGASGGENRYIIDGAETTNLRSGVSGKILVTDFIEEVQVKSSGYTAEYGGATGGVINVLTKSGTNSFRGDVGLYYQSDALDSDFRPTLQLNPKNADIAEHVTYPEDSYNRWEPGFSLGGPLKKDKVWFFAGYNPVYRPLTRTAPFNDGVTRDKKETFTSQYATANLTAQLTDGLRSRVSFSSSNRKTEGRLQAQNGSSNPAANFDINDVRPNYSGSISLDYTPSSRMFVSARAGYYRDDFYNEGVYEGTRYLFPSTTNIGMAGVPAQYQQPTGYSNVPTNNSSTRDIQKRMSAQLDATYFASFGGEHQIKGGIQLDRIANDVLSGETGNLVRLYWGRSLNTASGPQKGTYGYYRVRSNGTLPDQGFITQGDISSNNVGLFLQDSWTINGRLTLNLGLRTETESVPSYSSGADVLEHPIEFSFSDKIAPRAGFAWDVKGDGKWKVYGSWGIFYDITKLEMPRGSWGGDKWLEYWYTLDTYEFDKLDVAGCPPACPGRLIQGPTDFRHPSAFQGEGGVDPDLKPMRLQEAVAGVDRELTNVLSVGVRYVHKQIDRAIEDVGVLDADGNEVYTIANPGFGLRSQFIPEGGTTPVVYPKAQRDYDSVEVALNKRMANRWSARVSYLWSRLNGNYSGLSQSDENGRTSPNVGRAFDYPLMAFDEKGQPVYGLLGTDRTHQAKIQAVYDASFGTSVGLNFYAASGIPMTREAAWNPSSGYPIQYLGRGSDGRTPFTSQTDLYVQHEIKVGDRSRVIVSANVLNLFDQSTATNYFQTQLVSGSTVNVSETQILYQGSDFQQLIAAQGLKNDPRFLLDRDFQAQREIRLAVRFTF